MAARVPVEVPARSARQTPAIRERHEVVCRYVNWLMANDPRDRQCISLRVVADTLSLPEAVVFDALEDASTNAFEAFIDAPARRALEQFRDRCPI